MGELMPWLTAREADATVAQRLAARGVELPPAPAPLGHYERGTVVHGVGFLSGQFPMRDGRLAFRGRVGAEIDEHDARSAARLAALNALAQLQVVLGGFSRLERIARLDGYVAVEGPGVDVAGVLDAASSLFIEALSDRGRHARAAIAVPHLPLDAPVELVVAFAVRR